MSRRPLPHASCACNQAGSATSKRCGHEQTSIIGVSCSKRKLGHARACSLHISKMRPTRCRAACVVHAACHCPPAPSRCPLTTRKPLACSFARFAAVGGFFLVVLLGPVLLEARRSLLPELVGFSLVPSLPRKGGVDSLTSESLCWSRHIAPHAGLECPGRPTAFTADSDYSRTLSRGNGRRNGPNGILSSPRLRPAGDAVPEITARGRRFRPHTARPTPRRTPRRRPSQ